jgi:hypothetical protein
VFEGVFLTTLFNIIVSASRSSNAWYVFSVFVIVVLL